MVTRGWPLPDQRFKDPCTDFFGARFIDFVSTKTKTVDLCLYICLDMIIFFLKVTLGSDQQDQKANLVSDSPGHQDRWGPRVLPVTKGLTVDPVLPDPRVLQDRKAMKDRPAFQAILAALDPWAHPVRRGLTECREHQYLYMPSTAKARG